MPTERKNSLSSTYDDSFYFWNRDIKKEVKKVLENEDSFRKSLERGASLCDLIRDGYLGELVEWLENSKKVIEKDQKKIEDLTNQLEEAKQKIDEETGKLLENQSERISHLEEQLKFFGRQNQDLEKEIKKYQDYNSGLLEYLEKLEGEYAILVADKKKLTGEYEKLRSEVVKSNKNQEKKELEISRLESFLSSQDNEITNLCKQLKILQEKLESSEGKRRNLEEDLEGLEVRHQSLEKYQKGYQVQVLELSERYELLEMKYKSKKAENRKLKTEVAQLEQLIETNGLEKVALADNYFKEVKDSGKLIVPNERQQFTYPNSFIFVNENILNEFKKLCEDWSERHEERGERLSNIEIIRRFDTKKFFSKENLLFFLGHTTTSKNIREIGIDSIIKNKEIEFIGEIFEKVIFYDRENKKCFQNEKTFDFFKSVVDSSSEVEVILLEERKVGLKNRGFIKEITDETELISYEKENGESSKPKVDKGKRKANEENRIQCQKNKVEDSYRSIEERDQKEPEIFEKEQEISNLESRLIEKEQEISLLKNSREALAKLIDISPNLIEHWNYLLDQLVGEKNNKSNNQDCINKLEEKIIRVREFSVLEKELKKMRDDFLDRINKKYGEHKKESISEYLDQFLNAQKNIVKNNEDEKARRQRGEAYDHLQSKMSDDELVKMDKLSRKQKELVKTEMKLEITTEDFEIQIVQNLK